MHQANLQQDLDRARALLADPSPRVRMWPVLTAAAAFAAASLLFATAMVVAPAVGGESGGKPVGTPAGHG